MKNYKKVTQFKYCGEIVDRSWFDDPEAYGEGTYSLMLVSVGFSMELNFDDVEFFQAILRPNRVYLDEYTEQKSIRKKWFRWLRAYKRKLAIKIAMMIGEPYIVKIPESNIVNEICSLFSEPSDPYEHFYRRFMRKE